MKSFKLRKLQRKLTSIAEFGGYRAGKSLDQVLDSVSKQEKALQNYLDFCVSDQNVHSVMSAYKIGRAILRIFTQA